MKTIKFILPLFYIVFFLTGFNLADNPDAIVGTWLVGSKKAKIRIEKKDEKYHGKIIWMHEPNKPDGTPKTDANNPDKNKRNNTILNLELLKNFEYEGDNTWEDGKIYDPESGKEYSCIITLKDKNTLDVRGYVGFSLIGRSETWTRVQ